MTSPQQNLRSAQQPSAPPRFVAGAVDLGDVKRRAEARESAAAPGGVARSAAVTVESFEQDLVVRSTQVPVVLLIGSGRSPESEEMRAEFSRLVEQPEHPTWLFRHVDVDTSPEIAQALRVQAVPTVLALAAGR
ncbi:co-chaperone YbbN, partial [Corynebacterium bovis]